MKAVLFLNLAAVLAWVALIGLTYGPPQEMFLDYPLYLAGMIIAGLLCCAAVFGHKDAKMYGSQATIDLKDIFGSAPIWAWVLAGATVVCMVVFVYQLPEVARGGESSFSLDRPALVGRPDRWRFCLSGPLVFNALGAATAISAIRRRDAWMKTL